MGRVRCCLLCLVTQVKMVRMNSSTLALYNHLVSATAPCKLGPPLRNQTYACYECAYMLNKYEKFRTKCCKAYNILRSLKPEPFVVTEDHLKNIDRKENKLDSLLKIELSTANYTLDSHDFGSGEQFTTLKVKNELMVNSPHKENNENPLYPLEKFTLPFTFTSTFYNNENDNDQTEIYREFKPDVKNTLECNTDTDYDGGLSIEISRDFSEEESTSDDKNNVVVEIKQDIECINNDQETVIIETEDSKTNKKDSILRVRKRKCVTQNNNTKKLKKGNSSKTLKSLSKPNDKQTKKKISKKNTNEISNKNKDCRTTLDSSFFKDRMTITRMTPEEARYELLLRKESRNYKASLLKCDLCYRGFISEATYEAHRKKHSTEFGTLKCDICQFNFFNKQYLKGHWMKSHAWKLHCNACSYVCYSIYQAKSHLESHEGKTYTCKECGETFRFANTLSTHMRSKHSIEVVCEFCGSTFVSTQGLICHKRLRHQKDTNEFAGPQCVECNVHFASELAWKRHFVHCSKHTVQNGCGVCGDVFDTEEALRAHAHAHGRRRLGAQRRARRPADRPADRTADRPAKSDIRPMPCKLCNKELFGRLANVRHMNTEHPEAAGNRKKYKSCVCEVCGRFFKHNSFLVAHQRTHTDAKPYACAQCGKRFKNAYTLKIHMPLHTNEYRYSCELCNKAFSDRGRLNRHVKGHLGIRPYKCAYCDKSFLYQCEERTHTKYVHCKEPYPKRERRRVKKEYSQ